MKVAKLVKVTLITRVIVDVNATEQDIMELAIPKLSENLMDSPFENIDEIVEDTECPYTIDDSIDGGMIEKASNLLSMAYWDIKDAIRKIVNTNDQNSMIDYIDEVQVTEINEYKYSCKDFLKKINYEI